MKILNEETKRRTADRLIQAHEEASKNGDWISFVDDLYARDCIYSCHYAGVMDVVATGIDQIKETHYGRDMQVGWEGWEFPYVGVYVGAGNDLVTHWLNRGPGKRKDGTYFESPGISFITLNDSGFISRQLDMFDLAHQMKLCDELEAVGLLSSKLRESWVLPMKSKLIDQLNV